MFVYGPQGHYSSDSESESESECDPEVMLMVKKRAKISWSWCFKCVVFQRRREECERKARRGEMDPRLEFAFQLLMDGTGLPRHEIMDHVFEGDMVCEFWWWS